MTAKVITCAVGCRVKLLMHSETSTVQPLKGTCLVQPWPCRLWLFELWLDCSSSLYIHLAWVRSQGSSHCVLMNSITISMTRNITWLMALHYIGRRSTRVGKLGVLHFFCITNFSQKLICVNIHYASHYKMYHHLETGQGECQIKFSFFLPFFLYTYIYIFLFILSLF